MVMQRRTREMLGEEGYDDRQIKEIEEFKSDLVAGASRSFNYSQATRLYEHYGAGEGDHAAEAFKDFLVRENIGKVKIRNDAIIDALVRIEPDESVIEDRDYFIQHIAERA